MKKYYFDKSRDVAIFLCCVFCFFSVEAQVNIDWQTFLAKQDPVWETLPQKFDHGAFLGNGLLGTTIFQDAPQQLRFEIGRSDVTDHRRDNARLPIGGMLLKTAGQIQSGTLRTDLWNAEVRGEIKTDRGTVKFRAVNHAEEIVLIVDFDFEGEEKNAVLQWEPKNAAVFRDEANKVKITPNPEPETGTEAGIHYCEQKRVAGGSYTSAWLIERNPSELNKQRLTFTLADAYPADKSKREALKTVKRVAKIPASTLEKSHRQWWHSYYPESFVSVPDSQIEGFYWNQIYKLASATRRERMVIDLLGPWYRETGWPRIWWNLNIQLAYSPVYAANRLELGESFTRFIDAKRDNFVKNAKDIWKFDDCATTPHTTDYEGLRGEGTLAPDSYINPGDFTWALHLYWQQYRFSMDKSLVTDHKKHAFYPLLKQSVNLYLKLLKKGDDGKLHLPKFHSPEYGDDEDNNYNLSLLRWACETLLYLDGRYGFGDPMRPEWERVLKELVAYPQDENGFRIGKNIPFEHSHRHWSHILMVWPLHILSPDKPADRESVLKSVKHWLTVENAKGINGWSLAAASSIYSCLGDGDNALRCLRAHHNSKVSVMPNTQYIEGSPVIECSLVAAQSLQEMLMQSWGDVIRIFPAAPSEWNDIAFQDLRAEGAFLVTASRKNGRTAWIRIKSLAGELCRVKPDFTGTFRLLDASIAVRETEPGIFELGLKKGQEITLYQNENDLKPIAPVAIPQEKANFWGVKNAPTTEANPAATRVVPEKRVQELKDLRWGMFICWSFSTFSGREWTNGVAKRTDYDSLFPAKNVDTDQWARTAKEAGMGYILFLSKHHDGFCLWDTKTTERKVTNAPLGRDVLAELRKSCDRYGIKLALYFSEGDWTWEGAIDGKHFEGGSNPEMKKAQLKELLTQYGNIKYIWFDHAAGTGGLSHEETTAWCKTFQPDCFIGYNHGDQTSADIRLGEMGKPGPLDNLETSGPYMGKVEKHNWKLAEFTYPILPDHKGGAMWFYSLPEHDGLVHPASKLYEDYLDAVKYGNIFSINIGPDYEGKIRDIDVKTLREVGEQLTVNKQSTN